MRHARRTDEPQRRGGAEMGESAATNCKMRIAKCKLQIEDIRFLFASSRLCGSLYLCVAVLFSSFSQAADVDDSVLKSESDRIAAAVKAIPSVLAIFAAGGQGGGSGVVITPDGYALSNFHVTKPCGN